MDLQVQYQNAYSRKDLLLRTFFGWAYILIPHGIILYFLQLVSNFMMFITFFAVLFTGKYPESFFKFQVNVYRWGLRVNASLYNLVDGYPPFTFENDWEKVKFDVEYKMDNINRVDFLVRLFFGWAYAGIPHGIILMLRAIVAWVFSIVAFFSVLMNHTYPQKMHEFNVKTLRWQARLNLYLAYMIQDYPPFNGEE